MFPISPLERLHGSGMWRCGSAPPVEACVCVYARACAFAWYAFLGWALASSKFQAKSKANNALLACHGVGCGRPSKRHQPLPTGDAPFWRYPNCKCGREHPMQLSILAGNRRRGLWSMCAFPKEWEKDSIETTYLKQPKRSRKGDNGAKPLWCGTFAFGVCGIFVCGAPSPSHCFVSASENVTQPNSHF